ncbi:MAG TPA: MgtC/SapB family protein [Rhodanobacteraceae bacterium]|nr:MgtC/SapB family protein [Rhodanobacteraceae bacterium]
MLDWKEIVLRLLLACVLGGVIGFDRERRARAAGLRTHMLVALGAALVMIVSAFGFADILGTPNVVLDPSRVAAQVVSGIGFLGAGAILVMHRTEVVRGLTTAAGLWTVAAIGLASGSGMYIAAVAATLIAWVILVLVRLVEGRYIGRYGKASLNLHARAGSLRLAEIDTLLTQHGLRAASLALSHHGDDSEHLDIGFERGTAQTRIAAFGDQLRALDGINAVHLDAPRNG